MYSLFVGVDVSKDSFSVAGLNDKAKLLFSLSPLMNAQGFSELLTVLRSHQKDLSSVIVALESTGPYHLNLFSFLVSQGITTIVVNPLIIANFAKLSLRKTKTDKKDAVTIARFLFLNRDSISQLPSSQQTTDLQRSGERAGIHPEDDRVNEERRQKDPSVHLPRIGASRRYTR
jgi:transposase